MATLPQGRQEQTRAVIVTSALALFRERGFDQVTMADVASTVGVSRRTVYRRFPTKEQIVLEVPRRWLGVWDAVVHEYADRSPRLVAEAAGLAVARHIDQHRTDVLTAYAALHGSPGLASVATAVDHEWIERVVSLLRRESARLPGSAAFVVAGAYLGAVDAMMTQWVRAGGGWSVARETAALLERLRPIWPGGTDDLAT